jgi:hypothetical protein
MKKVFLLGMIITSLFLENAYAGQPSSDLCSKLPGHWQGIYTIKDQNACKLYNGCTHLVMADATYVAENEYHISLNPAVGEGGKFNIKCENGVITSPVNPGNKISASCDLMNHCFVVYDDSRLTSEMMKS